MLADKGAKILTLSETPDEGEPTDVELSATDIVERFLAVLPKKDGKTLLGEQHLSTDEGEKPPIKPDKADLSEEKAEERADAYAEDLQLPDEYRSKDGEN
jgi:hypothetical protein